MIFAKRNVNALMALVPGRAFFLGSRTSPLALGREARRLRREIRDFQPDLVHAHFGTVTSIFCLLVSPKPVVIWYRGSDINRAPSDHWLRSAVGVALSQVAALFAVRTICSSREMLNRLWWRRDRSTVIPTGVDTSVFYPRPRNEARQALGWDPAARIILFNAGREPAVKRLDLATAAVEEARKLGGPIQFEVMKGQTDPATVPLLMNAADCLLVTSDYEGSPTVVQEALACNLPVVTVDCGDVRERLEGVAPSQVVERDPALLGRALVDVLDQGVRSNGERAAAEISTAAVARRAVGVYRSALGLA